MELRQLEAFVAVATELHFGRAAEKLYVGQPTLSDLIRRLERELGAPLLIRTTRRVALTAAGQELLTRSRNILDEVAAAATAVQRITVGDTGTLRLAITPPVAPVLAPHLLEVFAAHAPDVQVDVQRMWMTTLTAAVTAGDVDVAITCGIVAESKGLTNHVFCAEPLLVGLRPEHRFAELDCVNLADLTHEVLGATRPSLFPAWALAQKQALAATGINPPTAELEDTDLTAARWMKQDNVDWIMLIASLTEGPTHMVIKPVAPLALVPFVLQWSPDRAQDSAVARFVHCVRSAVPPSGWYTQPDCFHHQVDPSAPRSPGSA